MTTVTMINGDKKTIFNNKEINQPYYLVFRRFDNNHYVSNHTYNLENGNTPADSLVCEVNKTWKEVVDDKLDLHELPKKLPFYIIEGFRKRLENDIKRSLYNDYKAYEEKHMLSLFDIEHEIFVKKKYYEAKSILVSDIKSLSKINDFFDYSIAIQQRGAMNIYETKLQK